MDFEEFLTSKKIDPVAFAKADADRYGQWKKLYAQMHPDSFVTQKKFLINEVRRRFLIKA